MRLIFKSLVVLVVMFGIGNYLVYLKTGHMPIIDLRERWGSDWMVDMQEKYAPDQLVEQAKKTVDNFSVGGEENPAAPVKVYKWTDANGRVHYGDNPNANGAELVKVDMRSALSPPDSQPTEITSNKPQDVAPHTPIEKARAAAEAMEKRNQHNAL